LEEGVEEGLGRKEKDIKERILIRIIMQIKLVNRMVVVLVVEEEMCLVKDEDLVEIPLIVQQLQGLRQQRVEGGLVRPMMLLEGEVVEEEDLEVEEVLEVAEEGVGRLEGVVEIHLEEALLNLEEDCLEEGQ
jgi:hypothetical protein